MNQKPVNSQSWLSHESVTSDFWGCDYGTTPVGHEEFKFFQRNFTVTTRWVNWTCLNIFWGQTRHLKILQILGWTPYCYCEGGPSTRPVVGATKAKAASNTKCSLLIKLNNYFVLCHFLIPVHHLSPPLRYHEFGGRPNCDDSIHVWMHGPPLWPHRPRLQCLDGEIDQ